jgi:cyclopropane fatty-acyl-phospholipid synthase-like methyltransferase
MSTADADRARQRDLVRAGYNTISRRYRGDTGRPNSDSPESTASYEAWIEEISRLLQPGASVLDLGCGAGVPAAKLLTDAGFAVTGVDISEVQIERARALVPNATFIRADMTTWESGPAAFDAIVSLYALIHVPLQDQRELIPRLARWLTPGGYLLAIVGHEQWTGVENYMGAPMFWDHADTATYLDWLEGAGFAVMWHRYVPEGASGHTLVLAQTT